MNGLNKKAMLIKVRVGMWGAYKSDKKASEAIQAQFSSLNGSGNYSKKLTGKGDLTDINSVKDRLDTFLQKYTLPWEDSGWRILPTVHYMEFANKLRGYKEEFSEAVSSFIRQYDVVKDNAKNRLGDLYNEADYPESWQLERKFYFDAHFMPMPDTGHFLIEVSKEEKAFLEDQARQNERRLVEGIVKECYTRIYNALSNLAEKLESTDNRWKESTINNLAEIVEIMPALNLTDDPELIKMSKIIGEKICKHGESNLKYSPAARVEAREAASSVLSNLQTYLGL